MNVKNLVRGSLFLALALLFQSLRLFIPIPPMFTTFFIGTLLNACILLAEELVGLQAALLIACITPLVAYAQQMLPLPVFIVPVAAANSFLVLLFYLFRRKRDWFRILVAASGKCLVMYGSFLWLLSFLALPQAAAQTILFVMSWPQFVTGVCGALLACSLARRLRNVAAK